MYSLLAQLAAPAIALLIIPAIFGVPGQANPIPQEAENLSKRYRVTNGALPPLINRKREAEAGPVVVRSAMPESALIQRGATIMVSLPKREPQPNAGSNVMLQPQRRSYGYNGCGGGGCSGGGCGPRGGWGW
jgi:hypothetical protein